MMGVSTMGLRTVAISRCITVRSMSTTVMERMNTQGGKLLMFCSLLLPQRLQRTHPPSVEPMQTAVILCLWHNLLWASAGGDHQHFHCLLRHLTISTPPCQYSNSRRLCVKGLQRVIGKIRSKICILCTYIYQIPYRCYLNRNNKHLSCLRYDWSIVTKVAEDHLLDRVIGSHMGCEFVDMFSSLLSRNMRNLLSSILALLGDMDLIRYECILHPFYNTVYFNLF